jgi:hypothetical protein
LVKQFTLTPKEVIIVYSDASATGCGALVLNKPVLNMVHHWNLHERSRSYTWREAQAIVIYLNLHKQIFAGKTIKWYTDNQGVTAVIAKGSMKVDLHLCSLEIFETCLKHNITLSVDWVPRTENQQADLLSKTQDQDDWGVDHRIFNQFNISQGPITLDVFASNISSKTQKFYSLYWCENTAGVDAFAYDWAGECCWVVPPPYFIPKAIRHMKQCGAHGIMVLPRWQASVFWPVIHNGKSWQPGITLLQEYIKPANFFIACFYGNDKFTAKPFNGNVLVLRVNFAK